MSLTALLTLLTAYLLGSLSSAILVCRLLGLPDPRHQGSGNPGATNVLRIGGRKAAAVTLAGDLLKGLLPTLAAILLNLPAIWVGLVGLAAFLGHLYPLFFRFQGGKGVATALGVLLGMAPWSPWIGLATIASWLLTAAITRISSLSALVAMALAPLYITIWSPGDGWLTAIVSLMVALLYWRHRGNIRRILRGEEKRIGR